MSTTTASLSTSASPAPSAAPSSQSGGGGSGGGPTSSPLLFFVALGFGVVFTNLWIIVGVKYCFRYNQRNRRLQHDENGEPIDMTTMPRAHRRRREKKLMSMDEVNERFPLMKYKAWMSTRAEEGLPTAGGVAAPSGSRAASLRNVDGVTPAHRKSEEEQRPSTPVAKAATEETSDKPDPTKASNDAKKSSELQDSDAKTQDGKQDMDESETSAAAAPTASAMSDDHLEDEDMDDQIQMAVPTEMLANPGDSCAICLDTLEDDDDVRGLTCGHAFHASCLDPWLTSRRACCPLCKADYYVPKPRAEGDTDADADRRAGRRQAGTRTEMPHPPQYAFMSYGNGRPRMLFPGRFMTARHDDYPRNQPERQTPRQNRSAGTRHNNDTTNADSQEQNTWRSRLHAMTPSMPNRFRRSNAGSSPETTPGAPEINTTTPSQLEAGR